MSTATPWDVDEQPTRRGQGAMSLWDLRPMHTRKFGQHSRRWFEACDAAFAAAMLAHPEERPSEVSA